MLYKLDINVGHYKSTAFILPDQSMSLDEVVDYLDKNSNDYLMWLYLNRLSITDNHVYDRLKIMFHNKPSIALASLFIENYHDPEWKDQFTNNHDPLVRFLADEKSFPYIAIHNAIELFDNIQQGREQLDLTKLSDLMEGVMFAMEVSGIEFIKNYEPLSFFRGIDTETYSPSHSVGTSLREVSVEETFERIVTYFPQLPTLWRETGTYTTMYESPFHLRNFPGISSEIRGVFRVGGKGTSETAAMVSAMMEYIERASWFTGMDGWPDNYKDDKKIVKATLLQMLEPCASDMVINPNDFNIFSRYNDEEIYWVKGHYADGSPVYVPAQLVFNFFYSDTIDLGSITSTGLASGNSMEEAKLHALLEIIERDAKYSGVFGKSSTILTPEGHSEAVQKTLEFWNSKGVDFIIADRTSEFGVPTFFASTNIYQGGFGSGTHLDPELAITRAVAEVNMSTDPKMIMGYGTFDPSTILHGNLKVYDNLSSGNINRDLELVENVIMGNCFIPIYVDLTRKDFDVPVVRALVPGLHHFGKYTKSMRQYKHFTEQVQRSVSF